MHVQGCVFLRDQVRSSFSRFSASFLQESLVRPCRGLCIFVTLGLLTFLLPFTARGVVGSGIHVESVAFRVQTDGIGLSTLFFFEKDVTAESVPGVVTDLGLVESSQPFAIINLEQEQAVTMQLGSPQDTPQMRIPHFDSSARGGSEPAIVRVEDFRSSAPESRINPAVFDLNGETLVRRWTDARAEIVIPPHDAANMGDTGTTSETENDTGQVMFAAFSSEIQNDREGHLREFQYVHGVTGEAFEVMMDEDHLLSTVVAGDPNLGRVQDRQDLPAVVFWSSGHSVAEPPSGEINVRAVRIKINPAPAEALTLKYTLTGTATAGTDYSIGSSGTVSVAAGQTEVSLSLQIMSDNEKEGDETIILTLKPVVTNKPILSMRASPNQVNAGSSVTVSLHLSHALPNPAAGIRVNTAPAVTTQGIRPAGDCRYNSHTPCEFEQPWGITERHTIPAGSTEIEIGEVKTYRLQNWCFQDLDGSNRDSCPSVRKIFNIGIIDHRPSEVCPTKIFSNENERITILQSSEIEASSSPVLKSEPVQSVCNEGDTRWEVRAHIR